MRRLVLPSVAAAALGGATVALAASLAVTSAALTSWSAAGSVPTSSCTLDAVEDSYVNAQSTGTNYGTATDLPVENGNRRKRTFVRFDVASCVPAGARILTAQLALYLVDAPSADRTWELHRVTGAWTETGITFANQPGVAAAATAALATGTTDGVWTAWDVLADVQAFADGTTNDGWRVWDQNDGQNPARGGAFSSREAAANTPGLAVTFYP